MLKVCLFLLGSQGVGTISSAHDPVTTALLNNQPATTVRTLNMLSQQENAFASDPPSPKEFINYLY